MADQAHNERNRGLYFAYGAIAYLLFLITFLYAIGFVGRMIVPKHVDSGPAGPVGTAIVINALLLSLFVVQHTIMARPRFKAATARFVPKPIERSTFVLATCAALGFVFWQWRPIPGVVWSVDSPALRVVLWGLFGFGWLLVLYSSFCIDHFDLFGLRQVYDHWRGRSYHHPGFVMPWVYRMVRNPLMLGFLIAFWATPEMTYGHLLFSMLTTGYIFLGISFEERDLLAMLDDDYRAYRARTPMLLPIPRRGPQPAAAPAD